MAQDILIQGKTYPWHVDEHFAALVRSPALSVRVDVVDSGTTYVGKAQIGAAEASAVWQIFRMLTGSDGDVTIQWADGDGEFDNIWANRATLSYS